MGIAGLAETSLSDTYGIVLTDYLKTRSEDALYRASLISQEFVMSGVGPEEIIALHFEQLDLAIEGFSYREQARSIGDAHQFLLEIMITYGVQYKGYLDLRMREGVAVAEAEAAFERERLQERERLDQEKNQMLEHIAHELRTPITTALGTLDMARRSLDRGQVHRLDRLLTTARDAVDRLSRLSAQIVQLSYGQMPDLERTPLQLVDLLEQACDWGRAPAAAKMIELEFTPCATNTMVVGDRDALLSVFTNLLSNAIRYTPEGGQIAMSCRVDGQTIIIECRDTGIGMSDEVQSRIFDRFYRSPEAQSVDAQGLGVGLSLVYALVQAHNGSIHVSSAPGEGSMFGVSLPLMSAGEGLTPDGVLTNGSSVEEQ